MKNGIIWYLSVPFRALALLIHGISVIRGRVNDYIAGPRMQTAFKVVVALTVLAWLVIWMFRDKYRDTLTEALHNLF